MRYRPWPLLLLLPACTWLYPEDHDAFKDCLTCCASSEDTAACTPVEVEDTGPFDADADGYPAASDCDDHDADVHPEAEEQCNGEDDDCDGEVDEDVLSTYYEDSDGDGYGTAAATVEACSAPSGFVTNASDCDDTDADTHPGHDETCDGVDNDCDGTTDEPDATDAPTWYLDYDGDGYGNVAYPQAACSQPSGTVGDAGDCDDLDAAVSPAATEVCDDIDNDCDGNIDEDDAADAPAWYLDLDGDGYGTTTVTQVRCAAPTGYVAEATDCDEGDATIHPAAAEVCDGADNDCDGSTDEDDAEDAPTWYADLDGDGFGDASSSTVACDQPSGYLSDGSDCDDSDSSVHPSADETCNGIDDDCDGSIDEDDAIDAPTWYIDYDADGYGSDTYTLVACEQPSLYVSNAEDCDDTDGEVNPQAREVCDEIDNDCDGLLDADDSDMSEDPWYSDTDCDGLYDVSLSDAHVKFVGERAGDQAGYSVTGAGDVNADGYGDLFIGARFHGEGGAEAGAGYLLLGPSSADLDLAAFSARLIGEEADDEVGYWLSGAGDVNADGYDDLSIGGRYNDEAGDNAGAAYLVFGPVSGDLDLADADRKLAGESAGDLAGTAVAGVGDVNADGFQDLLVGAMNADANVGAAYLVLGPLTGETNLQSADAKFSGEATSDWAGTHLSGAGDVNSDGYDDLLVGAYGNDEGGNAAGAAYLVLGPPAGDLALADADARLIGEDAGDECGSVSSAGDTNHDGYDDLLIGSYRNGEAGYRAGAAYLLLGPLTAHRDLADADAKMLGENANDEAGISVSAAGDINADQFGDLLIGARNNDASDLDVGTAYLVFGPLSGDLDLSDGDARLLGEAGGDLGGQSVAGVGDIDINGYDDILIGAPMNDEGGADAGAAYLMLGWGE